jgi:FtsP/CotA-like multicopper oxidase with cupredoxin domain
LIATVSRCSEQYRRGNGSAERLAQKPSVKIPQALLRGRAAACSRFPSVSKNETYWPTPGMSIGSGSIVRKQGVVAHANQDSTAPHARPSDSYRIELEAREVEAEIEPGARFSYMTYDGQVPGPMIRVRRGDTVTLTLPTTRHSTTWHSIDLHAVYTPGGEAEPLTVLPGRSKTIKLKRCTPARLFITVPCPAWMNTYAWDVRDDRGRTRRRLAPRP